MQGKLVQLSLATGTIEHTFNVVPQSCTGGGLWSAPTIDPGTEKVYLATGSPDACWTGETYVNAMVELRASDLSLVDSWQVPRAEWVFDSDFGATPTLFTANRGGSVRPIVGAVNKNGIYYALEQGALSFIPLLIIFSTQAGSLILMLVANSKIVPGTNRRKLKSVFGFAIRHQHQCEDEHFFDYLKHLLVS